MQQRAPTPGLRVATANRRRRDVRSLIVGVVLVAGGALGAVLYQVKVSGLHPVLAVARDVSAGHVIRADDLRPVSVATDDSLTVIPETDQDTVVGHPAAVSLLAGTLLNRNAIGSPSVIERGMAVVTINVPQGQYPSKLTAGDLVAVVQTPTASDSSAAAQSLTPTPVAVATVQSIETPSSGSLVSGSNSTSAIVSLLVKTDQGPLVAQAAGPGHVSLILMAPDH